MEGIKTSSFLEIQDLYSGKALNWTSEEVSSPTAYTQAVWY